MFSINSENEQQQKQLVATFVLPNRRSPTLPLLTILTTTLKLHKTTKENNSKFNREFWDLPITNCHFIGHFAEDEKTMRALLKGVLL